MKPDLEKPLPQNIDRHLGNLQNAMINSATQLLEKVGLQSFYDFKEVDTAQIEQFADARQAEKLYRLNQRRTASGAIEEKTLLPDLDLLVDPAVLVSWHDAFEKHQKQGRFMVYQRGHDAKQWGQYTLPFKRHNVVPLSSPSEKTRVERGLLLKPQWLDKILRHGKTWEIRGSAWHHKGPVALIERGAKEGHWQIKGLAVMTGFQKLFTQNAKGEIQQDLAQILDPKNVAKHQGDPKIIEAHGGFQYPTPHAWVFEKVFALPEPIAMPCKSQQTLVNIPPEIQQHIERLAKPWLDGLPKGK